MAWSWAVFCTKGNKYLLLLRGNGMTPILPLLFALAMMMAGCVKTLTVGVREHPYSEDLTVCLLCLTTPDIPWAFDCGWETTYGIGYSENTRLGIIFRRKDGDCNDAVETGGLFGRVK